MNPSEHPNVMVSSTYSDLVEHRKEALDAIHRLGFYDIGMEYDASKSGKDIIDSSMDMVNKAHAYVGLLSHRYGGVPEDAKRNPDKLSITELEYRLALDLGIPIYMFVMSEDHPLTVKGVEKVEAHAAKLNALKQDARKRLVCAEFSSVFELKALILQSLFELRTEVEKPAAPGRRAEGDPELPIPPDLLAIPDFVSGHEFVGRMDELDKLDRWAASSDPVMVIEAIGGAGKSALAWQWMKTRAASAGALWYSFYEGGADMAAFAAYALAYTTGRPLKTFRGRNVSDLAPELLRELKKHPYLLVLDGLERVLVAYHRIDASQARDDQVESGSEHRGCTKPSDAELLHQFVAAGPAKILMTSRLMPSVLTNATHHPLPGVWHLHLRGMHPDDAMRMMRDLGIRGDEQAMRRYFKENFDNHPLLLGIVAGLVNDYVRDSGNFDRWADDPQGGAALHLATLELKQRRTHILAVALNGLEPGARQLLSRIAALPDAVAFETLEALSPFRQQPESLPKLVAALQDLERRGLLQWDRQKNSYDLHPVVRGYAFDALGDEERIEISNQIVDHFQSKPPDRYDRARTVADLQQSINIFRAMVQANRLDDVASFYRGGFARALLFSVEAHNLTLALLKPFFPGGFLNPPRGVRTASDRGYLLTEAGNALRGLGRIVEAQTAYAVAVRLDIEEGAGRGVHASLTNLGVCYSRGNRIRMSIAARELALELAGEAMRDQELEAKAHLDLMRIYSWAGRFEKADAAYDAFRRLPTPADQAFYRRGETERHLCWLRFFQGTLTDELLHEADAAAGAGNNRLVVRDLCGLRGEFALQRGDFPQAITNFERYIEMTQAVGLSAAGVEARLALALARRGDDEQARRLLAGVRGQSIALAEAYVELGDREKARHHALAGYPWAWADGPEYSNWWELKRCRAVLAALGEPEPKLPAFDPKTAEPIPHEADVRKLIAKLKNDRATAQQ